MRALIAWSGKGFQLALVALMTSWFVENVAAQVQPDYLWQPGIPEATSLEPVPLGVVNVGNGNLHIEIPFVSIPQRGGKPYIAKMVYDSRIWGIFDNGSGKFWSTSGWVGNGWRFIPSTYTDKNSWDSLVWPCPGYWNWSEMRNHRFTDLNGTIRTFPLRWGFPPPGSGCKSWTDTTFGPSIDASGYWVQLTTWGDASTVDAGDGTRVFSKYPIESPVDLVLSWKDSNGNYMNSNTPVTDMLGRNVMQKTTSGSIDSYTFPNSANGSSTFRVSYITTPSSCTAFGVSGVTESCGTMSLPEWIELADGSRYEFTYETGYKLMSTMRLPTGETVSFTYANVTMHTHKNRWLNTVTRAGGQWTYTAVDTCGSTCNQITVRPPSGDETVYTFSIQNERSRTSTVKNYTGPASSNQLVVTVQYVYQSLTAPSTVGGTAFDRLMSTTTTWKGAGPSGADLVTKTENTWDSFNYLHGGSSYPASRGNITEQREYAYGSGVPGALLRKRQFSYLHESNSAYGCSGSTGCWNGLNGPNIVNRVTSSKIRDASNNLVAETNTCYDTTSVASKTGVINHDDSAFGTSYTLRGNPTVIQSWPGGTYTAPTCSGSTSWLRTTNTYDMTGQLVSTSDPKGNITTFNVSVRQRPSGQRDGERTLWLCGHDRKVSTWSGDGHNQAIGEGGGGC